MSNELIIPKNFGAVPAIFANQPVPDDLGAGIVGGFGVVSIRGKAWHIKFRGEEETLMRDDGDGARSSIEVVIVKAAPHLSKIFYQNGYVEGSTEKPDCWSTNGLTPDPSAAAKQSQLCANCPQNAWGSRVTPAGKPGKACSDNKRIAVVPLMDIDNEIYGGPMLLRIPPASLADVANYSAKMGQLGYPYYAVGTRIAFDVQSEYPKLIFSAIRVLTDAEAAKVAALQGDPRMARILSEAGEFVAPPAAQAFEQPPPAKPVPAVAVAPKVVAPAEPPPAPVKKSGFGATSSNGTGPQDAGDIPEGLKVENRKPKAAKPAAAKPVPPLAAPATEPDENPPVANFDAMLDELIKE